MGLDNAWEWVSDEHVHVYVEDRYTTQTVLKPSGQFYKQLAGFKTAGPIWYTTFTPARFKTD